jgi:AAA-like domain
LAAEYLDDEGALVLSGDEAWAYFRLADTHYEFLTAEARQQLAASATTALAGFLDIQAHLLVVHRELAEKVHPWARQRHERAYAPAPGWADRLAVEQTRLLQQDFWEKEVYLGIRLGQRGTNRGLLPGGDQVLGIEDFAISPAELVEWRRQAATVERSLATGALHARRATADEVAWLLQRSVHRALPVPRLAPTVRPWGRGDLVALTRGGIRNRDHPDNVLGRYGVTILQEQGTSLVSFLALSRFPSSPTALQVPGGEWLYLAAEQLGFPVEISVRMDLVSPARARQDVSRKLADAQDQESHYAETGQEPDLELADKLDTAKYLRYTIGKDRLPFVYDRVRLAVATAAARTPGESKADHAANVALAHAELERRVQHIKDRYLDLGIDVQRPGGDQLRLLCESMPGDRVRVGAYLQRHPLRTITGGMATASGRVGEPARRDRSRLLGPYIGVTRGSTRAPVFFDPFTAVRLNMEAAIGATGTLGSGKTNLAMLLTYQGLLGGAVGVVNDPKGDFANCLARVPGIGPVDVLDLFDGEPGLLDPFTLAPDPASRALLAIEALQLLLRPGLSDAREAAIYRAVKAVMDGEDTAGGAPSLWRVVRQLQRFGASDSAAKVLAEQLELVAELPIARLLFAPAGDGPGRAGRGFSAIQGLTIANLKGLDFPEPTVERADYSVQQRLAHAAFWAVSTKARQLLFGLDVHIPKLLVVDEAWMLTRISVGEKQVTENARMGRSRNLVELLASQNAGDLLGKEVRNCISAVFAFRSTDPTEVGNVLELLRVADTEAHQARISSLPTGGCAFRDLDGQVTELEVDLGTDELRELFDTNPTSSRSGQELPVAVGAEHLAPVQDPAATSTLRVAQ